jgi:CRP-like cAMP-binding protein
MAKESDFMRTGSFPTLFRKKHDPWASLKQSAQRRNFSHKDMLARIGDPAHELYLLVEGRVRLFSRSPQGRNLTLSIVESGDIFGEQVLFPNQHWVSDAQALSDGVLYAIPHHKLEVLLEQDPSLVLRIMENLGERLQAVERRLGDLVFKSVPERLAALLLDLVGPKARQRDGPTPVPNRYTHLQLAEMINTHRETVTKVVNRFRDDRLLDFDRKGIVLLDMDRLREMALR